MDAEDVLRDTFVDWGATTLAFGKFEGQALRDVDTGYVQWLRRWLTADEERAAKFRDLLEAVTNFLAPVAARRGAKTVQPSSPPPRSRAS